MRFGDPDTLKEVKQAFPIPLQMETLNSYDPWDYRNFLDRLLGVFSERDRSNVFYEYFVTVIPSEFQSLTGRSYKAVII